MSNLYGFGKPNVKQHHYSLQDYLDEFGKMGHPGFFPLTIKAAYIIGVIHDICSTVQYLLGHRNTKDQFYIPAYGVFSSGVDLLGRCIQGNNTHLASMQGTPDILVGFKWLHSTDFRCYHQVSRDDILIETSRMRYSIDVLMSMRHFAAHGQGTTNTNIYNVSDIDHEILSKMPEIIARGLEEYWSTLRGLSTDESCEALCNNLAKANVVAFRNRPIYKSWQLFGGRDGKGTSITNIFRQFDWSI